MIQQCLGVSALLAIFALLNSGICHAGPAPADSKPVGEKLFEKFVDDEQATLPPLSSDSAKLSDQLADRVGLIAQRLDEKLDQSRSSERFSEALARTINIDELVSEQQQAAAARAAAVAATKSSAGAARKFQFKPPAMSRLSLTDAYEPEVEEKNPHILHAKHRIDFEKLREQTMNHLALLPRRDRTLLSSVAKEAILLEESGSDFKVAVSGSAVAPAPGVTSLRAVLRLTASIIKFGIEIMDRFYQAPEFILSIPVIGEQLRELREQGAPLYHLVSTVRHAATLYKIMLQRRSDPSSGEDGQSAAVAKKMISQAGAVALNSIVHKMIKQSLSNTKLSEDDTQECISRLFFSILTKVIPTQATSLGRR